MTDVCLFAHFDKDATVDRYVLRYLAGLKQLSFSIVFVSTSPLGRAARSALAPYCDDVMLRADTGADFGSWAAGLRKHANAIDGRLLLANDSVYGPVGDLQPALARLTAQPGDFYGMVESSASTPHLQSWFVLLENHVAKSAAFRTIFARPFDVMSKDEIIRSGEIGLSSGLRAAGFRYRALYQPTQMGPVARNLAFNPMNYLWRELIADEGVPFLKVGAVRNYVSETEVQTFLGLGNPLAGLIAAHQRRTRANARPMGVGHIIYRRFIKADYRLFRRGSRLFMTINYLLCALLYKLSSRWLRQSAALSDFVSRETR